MPPPCYSPTASGLYERKGGREAGRPADKMRVGFEIFKILYRLNYVFGLFFICYHNNVTTVLELHFSRLLSSKAYVFEGVFYVQKIRYPFFSYQSLLLGTTVPNDELLRYLLLQDFISGFATSLWLFGNRWLQVAVIAFVPNCINFT